jgi:hypothetical protein
MAGTGSVLCGWLEVGWAGGRFPLFENGMA